MPHGDASRSRATAAAAQQSRQSTTIELTSRKSSVGKTTLFCHLTAIFTLPRDLGGKEATVVYIDNDGRFSATRLAQIVQQNISRPTTTTAPGARTTYSTSSSGSTAQPPVTPEVQEALNHVHVFRPSSSAQLLAILESVPHYLLDRTRHASAHRPLGLVVLDSATAFYWQDRFDREMARLGSSSTGLVAGGTSSSAHNTSSTTTRSVINALKALQARFECVVALSTTPTSTATASSFPPSFPPPSAAPEQRSQWTHHPPPPPPPAASIAPSPSPWTTYATLTLNLSRAAVPPFAPRMSLDECLRDRDARFDAVRKARIVATVLPSGPGAVLLAAAATAGGGHHGGDGDGGAATAAAGTGAVAVSFKIGEPGIEFE